MNALLLVAVAFGGMITLAVGDYISTSLFGLSMSDLWRKWQRAKQPQATKAFNYGEVTGRIRRACIWANPKETKASLWSAHGIPGRPMQPVLFLLSCNDEGIKKQADWEALAEQMLPGWTIGSVSGNASSCEVMASLHQMTAAERAHRQAEEQKKHKWRMQHVRRAPPAPERRI